MDKYMILVKFPNMPAKFFNTYAVNEHAAWLRVGSEETYFQNNNIDIIEYTAIVNVSHSYLTDCEIVDRMMENFLFWAHTHN